MTEPQQTQRTPEEQASFLLTLVEADGEFDDSGEPSTGWTSYRVTTDGSAAKLVVTHESSPEDDESPVVTTGTWILVPMGTTETPKDAT